VELPILSRYLYTTFEPASLAILQNITGLAHGLGFSDEAGEDYLQRFARLSLPLYVICADQDDLVNVQDSLECFQASSSSDKGARQIRTSRGGGRRPALTGTLASCRAPAGGGPAEQLVFVSDATNDADPAFGHCDILIGRRAVHVVWERLRIWLDARHGRRPTPAPSAPAVVHPSEDAAAAAAAALAKAALPRAASWQALDHGADGALQLDGAHSDTEADAAAAPGSPLRTDGVQAYWGSTPVTPVVLSRRGSEAHSLDGAVLN